MSLPDDTADQTETLLTGGQVNHVVRIGDTVRRATGRDMSRQHALFAHLAAKGFAATPRFLGHDEKGREILSFVPGEVLFEKDDFSDTQLIAAARLLRAYHDATVDFPPVQEACGEVMCHNDWTPANTTFVDDLPAGMIDFDTAMPGTRLWDLTYSTWMWLGLNEPVWTAEDQRRRLVLFVSAYGHPTCTPHLVAACLPSRQAGRIHVARQKGMHAAVTWAENAMAWTLDNITEHFQPSGLT
ncbi:MAG: phosphotransferase [Devosia sp.]|uniref:phosphotransferase n=1 Tax=Devosia sp. TaxID=1871048 RepID=UPI0024C54A94|nr:phosphotransferase [Devosia sp.]UYO00906.1 MAG: phosphotransferase [Devosia sp.]